VRTNARRDVPVAPGEARFPVVLFSHGYPLPATSGTFAAEELASHGYVVFSINHTYDTARLVFRDGTSAPLVANGDVGRIDTVEKILGPRLSVWVADARFLVNEIVKLDAVDPRVKGRLDLERIGYFGHSFGGATAFATLAADSRIKAGIDMDGAYFGAAAQARPTQPYMLMNGDKLVVSDAQLERAGATRKEVDAFLDGMEAAWSASMAPGKAPRYRARFAGVSHLGFSDMPLMIPAVAAGNLPAPKAHRLVNQYILAFFEQHLKGLSSPVLSGGVPDSVVTFTAVPAAQ
jgi:dienelactone hydrolase